MSEAEQDAYRRDRVGFVYQSFNLIGNLSAVDNVLLPYIPLGVTPELRAKAEDLLREVGLGHRLNHRPRQMSGGEQQRVAIARALIKDPVVILADEPTGNLDRAGGDEIIQLLREPREDPGHRHPRPPLHHPGRHRAGDRGRPPVREERGVAGRGRAGRAAGHCGPGPYPSKRRPVMRTRTRNILICALAGSLTSFAATESPACTDFRIKAADGTVIIGRTMDFEVPVLSLIRVFPRGERWSSDAPGTTGGDPLDLEIRLRRRRHGRPPGRPPRPRREPLGRPERGGALLRLALHARLHRLPGRGGRQRSRRRPWPTWTSAPGSWATSRRWTRSRRPSPACTSGASRSGRSS